MQLVDKTERYILDEFGDPQVTDLTGMIRWEMANPRGRMIEESKIEGVRISTVFMCMDVGLYTDREWDAPVLFETMIFGGKYDGTCLQARSKTVALANHSKAMRMVGWAVFRSYLVRVLIVPAAMLGGYILGRGL